ncbi:MAG: hypothetical protein JRH05_17380, partial [Deltaproteobacteria bacterium]|nr:hypothetical protein [Deltaproteobacteria bacterium]
MKIIDFHTHLLRKDMVNPTTLDFLEEVNPRFLAEIDAFAEDPSKFTDY